MTDRQQRQDQLEHDYREGVTAVAQGQWPDMAAQTWRECARCQRHTRWVDGACGACGGNDGDD